MQVLHPAIRSREINNGNGLSMHLLEAGFEDPDRPLVLLLHGFPELAYSWRNVMLPLADAGYRVVAPDQRGYGRTTGWNDDYSSDLASFAIPNLVRDILGLVWALGRQNVLAVVGHDFGSPVAAYCALLRPDVFQSVVMMSAPFAGPPPATEFPVGTVAVCDEQTAQSTPTIHASLAALERPRKHYQWYYSTPEANDDICHCSQGVHDFLRAYFHYKSADWAGNRPFHLNAWSAGELAKLPTYYVMDLDLGMAETVAPYMPAADAIADCMWLSETELEVYSSEYGRTGFQGGLQWYRCATSEAENNALRLWAGRTIDVPSLFVAGKSDWGVYQKPGAFEAMQASACTRMEGCHLVTGAGHWVQQEQPEAVGRILNEFLGRQHG